MSAQVEDVLRRARADFPALQHTTIHFFTDLGRNTWQATGDPACRQQLQALAQQASLVLVDLGHNDQFNLAVTDLEPQTTPATAGSIVRLRATVRNFAPSQHSRSRSNCWWTDSAQAQEQIDLPAGAGIGRRVCLPI